MKLKPSQQIIKRIDIKIVEFDGMHYKSSRSISVYETTLEEVYEKIMEMVKK